MKKSLVLLLFISLFACLIGVIGCNKNPQENSGETSNQIIIDVEDDCTMELNDIFSYDMAAALIDGEIIDPIVTVTHNDRTVKTDGNSFQLTKLGEYTVKYKFVKGAVKQEVVRKITCVDSVAPTIFMDGKLESKVQYGTKIVLPKFQVKDASNEVIAPQISVYCGEEKTENKVAINNNSFTVNSYNSYKVVATAKDSSGNEARIERNIVIAGANEFEYFNCQDYVLENIMCPSNGAIEYNSDKDYVFEGEGSLHFTTNINHMYPSFIFKNPSIADLSSKYGLGFWVYNPTNNDYKLDVLTYDKTTLAEKTTIIKLDVPSKQWTHHVVKVSDLNGRYNSSTDYLSIFFNGCDFKSTYAQMDLYFDAFHVYDSVPIEQYSIFTKDESYYNASYPDGKIDVLKQEDVQGIDINDLIVTVINGNGVEKALSLQDGKYSIPNVVGNYKINYLYKHGVDGIARSEMVKIKEGYKTVTTFNGFDDMTELDKTDFYVLHGAAVLSLAKDPVNKDNQVFKWANDLGQLYTFIYLGLTDEQIDALNPETDQLSFKMYIDLGGCGAEYLNLRVQGVNFNTGDKNSGKPLEGCNADWVYDIHESERQSGYNNVGCWKTYVSVGNNTAVLREIKENGGMWVRIEMPAQSGERDGYYYNFSAHCDYTVYFDDIEIIKAMQISDTVESYLKANIGNDIQIETVTVKTANDTTVELFDGKISNIGEYTISAVVVVDGVKVNYILKVKVE